MSTSAPIVNQALIYILVISAFMFFLIVFFMIYFLVRFRKKRNPYPIEIKSNWLLELTWVVIPTLIALTMFFYGLTGFKFLRNVPSDSIKVTVHARQWSWLFVYPNGKKSSDLIVPLGKNVTCDLISDDVIHGFFVPAFRIKQDCLPNIKTQIWFQATSLGSHYILCSQYCGLKHSQMISKLIVVPKEQYELWLKGEKINFNVNEMFAKMSFGQRLLYERGCVSCHSTEGLFMVGPTLKGIFGTQKKGKISGSLTEVKVDEAYIKESIINPQVFVVDGFPNTMPPGRNVLSDEEIDEIIKYLKDLK